MGVDYPSYLESSANSPPPNLEMAAAKLEKATIVIMVPMNFIALACSELLFVCVERDAENFNISPNRYLGIIIAQDRYENVLSIYGRLL